LTAESLAPHPVMHCGHKGLFLDRLGAGVAAGTAEIPRLVPYAHLVVQMRNRAYSPALGRFFQQDPNATVMALIEFGEFNGSVLRASLSSLALDAQFRDGANPFEYSKSNPATLSDPLGLWSMGEWWEDAREGAGVAWHAYSTFASFTDVHGLVQSMAEELVRQYAYNLESDAEWAADWEARDDAHTRLSGDWVRLAFLRGAYRHFGLDYWAESGAPNAGDSSGPIMAGEFDFPGWIKRLSPNAPVHHIATRFGRIGRLLNDELKKAGYTLRSAANALPLFGHNGPHDPAYHDWMLAMLRKLNRSNKSLAGRHGAVGRFLWDTGERIRRGEINIDPGQFVEPFR
jgi:hypothetical protein